jgi:hypothetical protein
VSFLDQHAREIWQGPSHELWLTAGIAVLLLAPIQWFLLR